MGRITELVKETIGMLIENILPCFHLTKVAFVFGSWVKAVSFAPFVLKMLVAYCLFPIGQYEKQHDRCS